MIVQLDEYSIGSEQVEETPQRGFGCTDAIRCERSADRSLPTSGEYGPIAVGMLGELVEIVGGLAFLVSGELRLGDGTREPVIALLTTSEYDQMVALGIGDAVLWLAQSERQLCAEDRTQSVSFGYLCHPDDAVEPVVVGHCQGMQPQAYGLFGKCLGRARTVEETEVGVAVQLGVRDVVARRRLGRIGRGVRCPLAAPGRAIAAVTVDGAIVWTSPTRQPSLQLRPRDRRVVVPHHSSIEHLFGIFNSSRCHTRRLPCARPIETWEGNCR